MRAQTVPGTTRVICFSARHDLTLPEMELTAICRVIETWIEQTSDLGRRFRWVQLFENKGELMGCSNPHPHGQVWGIDTLPNEPAKEPVTVIKSMAAHKRHSPILEFFEQALLLGKLTLSDI